MRVIAAADAAAVTEAMHELDEGRLVATHVGGRLALLADALDEDAVADALAAAGRAADRPPSVAVADLEGARHVARVTPAAREVAAKRLPGPVVVLLDAAPAAPPNLVSDAGAVAVRVPEEEFPRRLASAFGPVTAMRAPAASARVALRVDGPAGRGPATVVDARR